MARRSRCGRSRRRLDASRHDARGGGGRIAGERHPPQGLRAQEHAPRPGDAGASRALPRHRHAHPPLRHHPRRQGRRGRRGGERLDLGQGRARGDGPQERPDHGQPHGGARRRAREIDRGLRPRGSRTVPDLHRALLREASRSQVPAAPGRRHPGRGQGRRQGTQDPEDAGPLPARRDHDRIVGEGGRPALRPDVGGLRGRQAPRLHPRRRPRGVLHAHRTGSTSATTSWASIPTGPSTERTFRASRRSSRPGTASMPATPRRSSSRSTSATTPRTWAR